jgi:hypothetical protein
MKYFFTQVAVVISLMGMILGCGKTVDAKLTLQITCTCTEEEYTILVSGINKWCLSIFESETTTQYRETLCEDTVEKVAYKVDFKQMKQEIGSNWIWIKLEGFSGDILKVQGTTDDIPLDEKNDVSGIPIQLNPVL